MSHPHGTSPLEAPVHGIEAASGLDAVASPVAELVRSATGSGTLKDVLSGSWLGHALHPLLTDVVIGSFTSATILDVLGGDSSDPAAERLIAVGIAAYGATAATGASDWADESTSGETKNREAVLRVGLVHAVTNSLALSLYVASLVSRRRGETARGKVQAAIGAGVLGAAAYLGGHLTLSRGAGVDETTTPADASATQAPAGPA